KRGSSSTADIIFQQGPPGQNTGFHAGFRSNGLFTFAFWADDLNTAQSYNDTNWHQWVCTYDAPTYARKIFRDGINIASDTAVNHFLGSGTFYLGYDGMVNEGFDGQLDESRLLKKALSSEWINTSYINQNDPESFYSIGKERSLSDPPNAKYFTYYKEIIIDHSMVSGSSDLLNFPVLISLLDTDLHDDVQSNGNDIAFANDTAWLDHEIETFNQSYDEAHAQLIAWVRIPRLLTSLDTIIRMYYGNSTMGSRENPASVWNSDYKGVWHLSEDPSGIVYDSTTNNNDGSSYGSMDSGDQIVGKIDGSINFDGNDDNIATEENNVLAGCSSLTMSAWIKPLSTQSDYCGIIEYDNTTDVSSFDAGMELRSTRVPRVNVWTTSGFKYVDSSVVLPISQFTYFVFVYDGDLNIYLDGSFDSSTPHSGNIRNNLRYINIGRNTHDGRSFNGTIDEVHISNIARSASWIKTEYNNQYKPSNFYSIGKEYPVSGIPAYEQYFDYYKEIIIDKAMVSGSHELINFPLLISILDEDLYSKAQVDGDDIAFTYNGAWLDHEIEHYEQNYDGTHAQLIAWVSLPRLSTLENTVIRMYYGNSTMNSRQNPSEVWNTNYKGVWHLSEDPTGTVYDSTSNHKDGTSSGSMTSNDQISGKINGALDFDGSDDTISFGSWTPSTDFNPSSGTISFWINRQFLDSVSENKMVLQIRASGTNRIMFRYDGGGYEWRFHHEGNDIQTVMHPPAGEIPRLEWIYVVQTWDVNSDFLRGYINGSLFSSNSGLAHPTNDSFDIYLASDMNGGEYFYGSIDEVRFSDIY
ncbi:MAG: DUF2341 domain-containing protein, partial [Promethearchaeota archaeon]